MAIAESDLETEVNWALVGIVIAIAVVAIIVGLFFFGFFDQFFPKEVIEEPIKVPTPVEQPKEVPKPQSGLQPTTPQLNLKETDDTQSLTPKSPQPVTPVLIQQGNMDDVKPSYRNHLESLPIAEIIKIQDYPCDRLSELDYPPSFDRILRQRSNEC